MFALGKPTAVPFRLAAVAVTPSVLMVSQARLALKSVREPPVAKLVLQRADAAETIEASTTPYVASASAPSGQCRSTSVARKITPPGRGRERRKMRCRGNRVLNNLRHPSSANVQWDVGVAAGREFRVPEVGGSFQRLPPDPEPHTFGWTS